MSNDQLFIVAILTQMVTAFAAVLAFLKGRENEKKIETLHVAVDGQLKALLIETAKANHLRGIVDARSGEDERTALVAATLAGQPAPPPPGTEPLGIQVPNPPDGEPTT